MSMLTASLMNSIIILLTRTEVSAPALANREPSAEKSTEYTAFESCQLISRVYVG